MKNFLYSLLKDRFEYLHKLFEIGYSKQDKALLNHNMEIGKLQMRVSDLEIKLADTIDHTKGLMEFLNVTSSRVKVVDETYPIPEPKLISKVVIQKRK